MGLDSYDQETPRGSTSLNQGDNKIRELAQKTCNSVEQEHNLNGKHKIPNGSLGDRPADRQCWQTLHRKRPGIRECISSIRHNGSRWVDVEISSEAGFADDLSTHQTAATLDHPNGSVTTLKLADLAVVDGKIGLGALKKRHLISPGASDSILREAVQQELRNAGSRQFVRAYIPESLKQSMSPEQLENAKRLEGALNTLAERAKRRKELRELQEAGG